MSQNNPIPQGKYVTANRYGSIVITAGLTPRDNGKLILTGKVSGKDSFEVYREAVRLAAANALKAANSILNDGEKIAKIISMTVYINAVEGFCAHAKIADFASEYLCEQLGEAGVVSRAAIGVASLPGDAPVEIQLFAAATK